MTPVTLSVVIGTYNRLTLLQKCLQALTEGIHVSCEIVVVDAGSTDGTRDYLKQLQGVHLVEDEALIGQAQSLNRVMLALQSEFVCWLSDDNVLVDRMLDTAVRILKKNHKIGMVGLKVKDVTGHAMNRPYIGGTWISGVLNCNQGVLPTQLFQQLGGFDEEFCDYGIDADLTTRVLLAGYQVVLTKRVAIHHFRDHDNVNWTDVQGRKERGENAKKLYVRKYDAFIEMTKRVRSERDQYFSSRGLDWIIRLYEWLESRDRPVEKYIKVMLWNWRNLLLSRFISKFDFVKTLVQPYYLVQKLPEQLITNDLRPRN